jgi:predicted ATPase
MDVSGDLTGAERLISQLKDHAERHGLSSCYACGLGYEGLLAAQNGDFWTAIRLIRSCLGGLRQARNELLHSLFLAALAEILTDAGRSDESHAAIDEVLSRAEKNGALWSKPAALRIKGEALMLTERGDGSAAEDHFRRSINLAQQQGALFWELRSSVSLGKLHSIRGRKRDAYDLVSSIYAKFTEGFEAVDLRRAKSLLDEWAPLNSS